MFEGQSPESPLAAVTNWLIAFGLSGLVLFYLPVEPLIEAATRPLGIFTLLLGIVIGGAQDAATLMNQQIREVASNRRVVFVVIFVGVLVGLIAGVIFAENAIIYLEVACLGFVYSAAVVRTVAVWQHSRS